MNGKFSQICQKDLIGLKLSRFVKEEDLDTIGEILSNLEGALEVAKLIDEGSTQKDALNTFMKRVISVGK